MPLPPPEGSLLKQTQTDRFDGKDIVKDTTVNRTAFIESDYKDASLMTAAYIEGHTLECVYYTLLGNDGLQRSSMTDITSITDDIDVPLMKISQFEMKTQENFSPTYDSERNETQITGTAVVYPNFYPRLGDVFIYGLTGGLVGLFQIAEIEPLTYFNQRLHRVGFYLNQILSTTKRDLLESKVVKHVIFSRENLLEGTTSLLTSDSYTHLQDLRHYRHVLIQTYFNQYYSDFYKSLINEKGVYDPYIVRFFQSCISYKDYPMVPIQLYPNVDKNFNNTILSRLLDQHDNRIDNLSSQYTQSIELSHLHDVNITALLNRNYLDISKDGTDDYIFSKAFYDEDKKDMNSFEILVYDVVKDKIVSDVDNLIKTHLKNFNVDITTDNFYRYPILVRLIDIATRSVLTGKL